MRLRSILKNCKTRFFTKINNDINIKGICTNSKNIKDNFIFGAIRGNNFNGEDFIKDFKNLKNLVVIISTKSKYDIDKLNKNISIVETEDVRKLVSEISYLFFS